MGDKGINVMVVCDICGNESEAGGSLCPFCGSSNGGSSRERGRKYSHRVVNLEAGRPVVEVALKKLARVIEDGQRTGVTVITIIHGYGSSGKGGVIRSECRKTLDYMKTRGSIKEYIAGEEFSRRLGPVKALIQRFPQLGSDKNLDRSNRGITLIVLS